MEPGHTVYLALGDSISIDDYTGVSGGGAVSQLARKLGVDPVDLTRDGNTTQGVLADLAAAPAAADVVTLGRASRPAPVGAARGAGSRSRRRRGAAPPRRATPSGGRSSSRRGRRPRLRRQVDDDVGPPGRLARGLRRHDHRACTGASCHSQQCKHRREFPWPRRRHQQVAFGDGRRGHVADDVRVEPEVAQAHRERAHHQAFPPRPTP
jgi:hypothetical protein